MVDLETLALLAAAIDPELRPKLNPDDFKKTELVAALQTGKGSAARDAVAKWLKSLGVEWDHKRTGIGTAIIETMAALKAKQRALRMLDQARWKLLCPSLGSKDWEREQHQIAVAIEQYLQGSGNAGKDRVQGASAEAASAGTNDQNGAALLRTPGTDESGR